MTTLYSLDIGFDRLALPRPGSDPQNPIFPLQSGITLVGAEATNPVAQARHLELGSSLLLTIYDLTREEEDPTSSPVEEMSFRIAFHKAREQTAADTPAAEAAYEVFSIHPGELAPGKSSVFDGTFQNWNGFFSQDPDKRFPNNQLDKQKSYPPAEGIDLINDGHFYFVLELNVLLPGTVEPRLKRYRTDPEMILNPDIGGPDGGG